MLGLHCGAHMPRAAMLVQLWLCAHIHMSSSKPSWLQIGVRGARGAHHCQALLFGQAVASQELLLA